MLQINGLDKGLDVFKCLGSEVRMKILGLLAENGEMNLNEIARSLGLTNGALTSHIQKMEACGLIQVVSAHTGHGMQKLCSLKVDQMLLNVYPAEEDRSSKVYETSVRVGHFSDYLVHPGCGLVKDELVIGAEDDSRCFAYPERLEADLLWLHDGYVEYRIPNLLPEKQLIVQVTLSFEVSSADQGSADDTQSMLHFYLNGQDVGSWLTFTGGGRSRGIYTPPGWNRPERRHGYLKMLVINQRGAFLDGVRIAETGDDLAFLDEAGEIRFRIETHPEDGCNGGVALYGSRFGNYNQDILARIHYMPEEAVYGWETEV